MRLIKNELSGLKESNEMAHSVWDPNLHGTEISIDSESSFFFILISTHQIKIKLVNFKDFLPLVFIP